MSASPRSGARRGERFISAAVQRERIEAWATLHGARLGEVFGELDESGGRRDRPQLLRAIRRVETDAVGLVGPGVADEREMDLASVGWR